MFSSQESSSLLPSLADQDYERILLIKPSAVGDVIHTIPVLVKLRARYPRAQIDWLLTPENAALLRHHPSLSKVVIFERQSWSLAGRRWKPTKAFLRFLMDLRRERYDLVIDLHGQFRSAVFSLATGAAVRIGFDKPIPFSRTHSAHYHLRNCPQNGWRGAREGSWLAYSHRLPIPTLDVHAIERYLWVGPLLGLDSNPPDMRIFLPTETEAAMEDLVTQKGLLPFAVLAPGTQWETKHWPVERFAEVGRILQTWGLKIVIIGSRGQADLCRTVEHHCPGALNLAGQTTLADVAALQKRSKISITNDSGPMHLAVALGRPVVAIFGPTNPVHIGPFERPEAVVRVDLSCSPCNFYALKRCPHNHDCMQHLTVGMVIQRIEALLQVPSRNLPTS